MGFLKTIALSKPWTSVRGFFKNKPYSQANHFCVVICYPSQNMVVQNHFHNICHAALIP